MSTKTSYKRRKGGVDLKQEGWRSRLVGSTPLTDFTQNYGLEGLTLETVNSGAYSGQKLQTVCLQFVVVETRMQVRSVE